MAKDLQKKRSWLPGVVKAHIGNTMYSLQLADGTTVRRHHDQIRHQYLPSDSEDSEFEHYEFEDQPVLRRRSSPRPQRAQSRSPPRPNAQATPRRNPPRIRQPPERYRLPTIPMVIGDPDQIQNIQSEHSCSLS
ncbi:hypothetical protein Ddc_24627 [Ditylenchus destructor]|nr:hypothetical protein Ddc_24627 [Ditylenchus destructor]